MRRILIANKVTKIAQDYLNALNDSDTLGWREMPRRRLKMIYDELDGLRDLRQYVSRLLIFYDQIILLPSSKFRDFHEEYFGQWDESGLNTLVNIKGNDLPFYQAIQWAMRYEDVRKNILPTYLEKLKINACVYCNEKSIVSGEKIVNGKHLIWTRYEVDHFYPKDKYPYLSTSFYNFQPSCGSCNGSKSDQISLFNLYTDDVSQQDVFHFTIGEDDQILQALVNYNPNYLEINLEANNEDLRKNHDDLFHVESVYQNGHRDDAWRIMSLLYSHNDSYIKSLKSFLRGHLAASNHDILMKYFLEYDYYMDKDKVHEKVLNKLAQDIAEFYGNRKEK